MSDWFHELRYAVRVLWKNRTATLVAFVTLALAIGATTSLFTVVDATLVRALPFPEADGLVQIARGYPDIASSVGPPKFLHWREHTRGVFAHVAAYESLGSGFNLVGAGQPDRLIGSRVSAEFFSVMGVPPILGREFRREEDLPGQAKVVVLSHQVWTRRFGARADLVGQAITLNGEPYTVIGIMPEGFRYPDQSVLWTLFQFDPAQYLPMSQQNDGMTALLIRLLPIAVVVRAEGADGSVGALTQAVQQAIWSVDPTQPVSDVRLMREIVERSLGSQTFNTVLLGGFAGLALLLAAVGLYGVISHLVGQQTREIGIRMALGATHTSVLALFVRHALLLVVVGMLIGLAGAFGLTRFLSTLLSGISTTDPWVFVLAPALLLAIALIAALRPALRAARIDPARALRAD